MNAEQQTASNERVNAFIWKYGRALMRLNRTRGDDMPMVGKLTRESKRRNAHGFHKFVVILKFKQSKRLYGSEVIHAVDKRNALRVAKRNYPSATIK